MQVQKEIQLQMGLLIDNLKPGGSGTSNECLQKHKRQEIKI